MSMGERKTSPCSPPLPTLRVAFWPPAPLFPSSGGPAGRSDWEGGGRLIRFDPDNAHAWGLSIHGAYVGAWRIRRLQTKIEVHTNLPRFGPPEGKDLHPACLILYCLYNWSCYNGVQMGSDYGQKRWRVLAYVWDLCEIRCLCDIGQV
jgi:hypothetical protein